MENAQVALNDHTTIEFDYVKEEEMEYVTIYSLGEEIRLSAIDIKNLSTRMKEFMLSNI